MGLARRAPGGDGWLLRDASLRVAGGERLAITGPTGAGKTLLLRALALLDPLDAGEVRWRGRSPSDLEVPAFRRRVVYLHQRPRLFDGSVEENLRRPFEFAVSERSYDPERVRGLLGAVGRDHGFLARSTADLSGGETQIVAFVRAIQLDPLVLLLDEPTAALDRDAVTAIEGLVGAWRGERPADRALVWVSHDREQADRVADRVVAMHAGRIEG